MKIQDKHFLFIFVVVCFIPALIFATIGYGAYGLFLVVKMILKREMP